ncbi:MAG TPA: CotH kinase family protein, partial [Opitutaceae bacterium]|nr:CotH kinase family protein [Opitutaceae bacterium]
SFALTLSGAASGEVIRYTAVAPSSKGFLQVPDPTATSPQYTAPLTIAQPAVIRAAVFSADGTQHGPVAMVHYFNVSTSGPLRADTFTSSLPVVVLGTHGFGELDDNGAPIPGWLHLFAAPRTSGGLLGATQVSTKSTLRVRGNSSALFPKKSYNLDLLDSSEDNNSQALLGMAKSDEWALVGPWNYDRTYLHNAFVYTLSNRMGRWAPQTRFVETFFDGDGTLDAADYTGVAMLTERIKVDDDRLDIASLETKDITAPAITGGYLLKIDTIDPDHWSFVTDHGIPNLDSAEVVVLTPKADKLPQVQRDYIRGYVQGMENALFAGRDSGWSNRSYTDFIDVPSWVDHHLLEVFSANIDALAHSDYFHKDRGGKLVAGPVWDFDRALGSYDERTRSWDTWNGGPVDVWAYGWYGIIARDPEFMQAWIDRWQSLRREELSNASLSALADSMAAQIGPEAAARDAARWRDNVSATGSFTGEIARLRDWLGRRANWIDSQFVAAPVVTETASSIAVQPPAGAQLAYTLDGSDPRSLGGELAPNARLTSAPLVVAATENVHVRAYRAELRNVFPGGPWSSAVGGGRSSPLTPKSRLVNISARGLVGTGENALIAGVVVADTSGKSYLARAIGPTLAAFGATGVVPDPQLSIFNANNVEILRNNGWGSANGASQLAQVSQSVGAFPLTSGSLDSAVTSQLSRGSYTMQVTTPSGRSGIGLAELYELDASGRTLNLSTRAQVRTGAAVLIGGFVVQGAAHKRMLIRAVGPALRGFGLASALTDPVLTVYSGSTPIASNDRWSEGDAAAAIEVASGRVGAFALTPGSEDAALLITLPPGNYTVEVKGKAALEGVALLEIYEVP